MKWVAQGALHRDREESPTFCKNQIRKGRPPANLANTSYRSSIPVLDVHHPLTAESRSCMWRWLGFGAEILNGLAHFREDPDGSEDRTTRRH
jgi:hypothetical protein